MNTATLLVMVLIGAVDFDKSIAPILARHCLDCHSGADPKGKLDLSRRASSLKPKTIVPGKPEESAVWERVEADEMPPKTPLNAADKAALRAWIAAGAAWGADPIDPYQVTTTRRAGRDWWSLQPVKRPAVPTVRDAGWVRTPIDAFVLKTLEAQRLEPSPESSRASLIRRLSFDLTGLPPTPEDVDAFRRDDSPEAYDRLVDRYLASPQYGVRWARWWLDLARYAESNGFEFDEFRPNAWRYRDWVVNALNRDMPYDQFARLQLAGDVLQPEDPEAVSATGFLAAGAFDSVGQNQLSVVMKAVVRADEMEDLVGTVGQTFLGLTINCARCHDHKFDPIRQSEYYRIAAALEGVRQGERDLSTIAPESIAVRNEIARVTTRIAAIEAPARAKLAAGRAKASPAPIAAWNFDQSSRDAVGGLDATLEGGASLTSEGLHFDGKTGYALTPPLTRAIRAKTLEVWLTLDRLDQRGGGAISLQIGEGSVFDGIVFAEQIPGEWMAGSDFFRRTKLAGGPVEKAANQRTHLAITYAEDGMIRLYRNGEPYGQPYKSVGPASFAAGETRVLFGMRHGPVGGNRMLAGTIARARVYDRALEPSEVAASAESQGEFVPPSAIIAALSEEMRDERAALIERLATLRKQLARQSYKVHAVTPRTAGITRVQLRGNPAETGEVVAPGGVAAVVAPGADFEIPSDAPEAVRRQKLAGWITTAKNPLFARVIVNRLWQAHFGTGLVDMSSDFGFNGGVPSHPELLDWLAAEMAETGWSLKAMHRRIVTSATYRQASRLKPEAIARDAGNRWLWRKSPVRLEAEMVRDAMLFVSGALDPTLGGPSFRDQEIVKAPGTAAILYVPRDPAAPGMDRRTLYRAWARGGRSAFLDAFDCPDPSTTAPKRAVTTTPLQALSMMNNALVLHLSERFAARIASEAGNDPATHVDRAYVLAFGRKPDGDEREAAIAVVKKVGTATLARALFNSNEFLYIE